MEIRTAAPRNGPKLENCRLPLSNREEGDYQARKYLHVIKDTEARPGIADFERLAKGCDLLVIPAVPSKLDIEALKLTISALRKVGTDRYRVLLTKVPPKPETDRTRTARAAKSSEDPGV